MKVSFEGIGKEVMTFLVSGTAPVKTGCGVALSGNGEVKAADANTPFAGICLHSSGDFAAVQTRGVVTCEYSGSSVPAVGYGKLAAAEQGVTVHTGGREYLVLAVDTGAKTVTFVL